ncbi:MAG TPA: DUF4870 domain-containing protein [Methylomirabilota bacterium]|nr:DUF4870 domain-containing protein [Methylomirabilota bacterium]
MTERTAATLSYVLGWLTGLIFFLTDNRPYVKFHAAQSIVTFAGLHVLQIIVARMFGYGFGFGFPAFGLRGLDLGIILYQGLGILWLVLWILLMVKASQGVRYKLPVVGEIAENLAGK